MSKKTTDSRDKVHESLLDQIRMKGAEIECYKDMLSDYMAFWDTKNLLIADIRDRGVVYEDKSAAGYMMQKNNPSVKELVMVNRQMLTILKELGLKTDEAGGGDGAL